MQTIRQATELDLESILRWTIALHQHEDDGQLKPHKDFENKLRQWIEIEQRNANNLTLIAEVDELAVGFISASTIINDNGFLEHPVKGVIELLWVEESYRNQNFAARLVSQIEDCFQSIGVKYVECYYTANNQLAKSFWLKQTYKPCSTTVRKILG